MTSLPFSQLHSTLEGYEATLVALEATNSESIPFWQIYLFIWALESRSYSLIRYVASQLGCSPNSPSREQILDVLIARDAVQAALMAQSPAPRWSLLKVQELDNRLKGQSEFIVQTTNLADWRSIVNPSASAWWWFLDQSILRSQDRLDWLWSGLSISSLTISVALVTNISSRWLSGGIDELGSIAVVAQSVLTLITARTALTKTGGEVVKRLLERCKFPKHYWHELSFIFALLLMGGLFLFHRRLPQIADYYSQWGIEDYNAIPRRLASAQENFQIATKLDPDNAEAHYGLGNIYEELGNLKQAQTEYEIAVQGGLPDAYNNLARLYILNQQSDKAAVLLNKGLIRVSKQDKEIEYSMRKNLGWARLEQKRYDRAEAELREAIQLTDDLKREGKLKQAQAAPYCLLAQVLECKGKLSEANKTWKNCKQHANPSNSPEEDSWLHLANQRLKKGGKPSCDTDC